MIISPIQEIPSNLSQLVATTAPKGDGQQNKGHQEEYVQQGQCRCAQGQTAVQRSKMGLVEFSPKLMQNPQNIKKCIITSF